jgi:hypothetical protein
MKKAFIITSLIDVDTSSPLTYSTVRSCFTAEERLRQTLFTITSLDFLCDQDTTIFLVDASENWEKYKPQFEYQKNLVFISVKDQLSDIYQEARVHPNKSRGECLIMSAVMKKFKQTLLEYDYLFKISGRYFLNSTCNFKMLTADNLDKFLFKRAWEWEYQDRWGYHMVDLRGVQRNNKLYQYPTTIYGWGKDKYQLMIELLETTAEFLSKQCNFHYDVETLLYYYTRPYAKNIIDLDWVICGFDGVHGDIRRY